ncbi:MAG: hypothetical protein IKH64_02365 [Prevotella sp.]|jgi:hypothetical protein|nr:hypothetical protein [Prevotella sp.]
MKKYIKPLTYCYRINTESLMVTASLPVVDKGRDKIEDSDQVLSKKDHRPFDLWGEDD